MLYEMKRAVPNRGQNFPIRDENGRDAFIIHGAAAPAGEGRVSLQDTRRRELAFIRRRPPVPNAGPCFELYYADELHSVVNDNRFSSRQAAFALDHLGPDDLQASGDLAQHEYRFTRDGKTVATVSKRLTGPIDTYGVEIASNEDDLLVLASAVVIDLCCHPEGQAPEPRPQQMTTARPRRA